MIKMMKNIVSIVTATGGLMLISAIALAQQPQMPPATVSIAAVSETTIVPTMPIAGTVYSRNDVQITAGTEGQLIAVLEPGTFVEKGDIVARIDDLPLKLRKKEQEALARRAQINLEYLNNQVERQQSLADTYVTSVDQLEQTRSNRDLAESDLEIASFRIQQIDDQLKRAVIRAPFTGVLTERLRREGEDVARGAVLARMTDTENLEVRIPVPLTYAGRVSAGDEIRMFGFESEFTGEIRTVIPSSDVRSQTFEIRVDLPADALQAWTVGQLVSAAVPMRTTRQTLAVPRDALILRREGTFVFRINSENIAERVAVELGESAGDLVAISGQLSDGDRVAIRGAESLREGQAVNIISQLSAVQVGSSNLSTAN